MKKRIIGIFLFLALLAASCGRQEQQIMQDSSVKKAECKELEEINLEKSAVSLSEYIHSNIENIIYFDDSRLVYLVNEQSKDSTDTVTCKIYMYDKVMGKEIFLLEVPDVNCSKGDICFLDNKVYYAFGHLSGDLEYNSLLEVNLEEADAQLIPIKEATVPFVDITVTDDNVFILKRNEVDKYRKDFIIERLDGQEFIEVANYTYIDGNSEKSAGKNETVLDISGEDKFLYLYKKTADGSNYFVCMGEDGEEKENYEVDITEDMKLKLDNTTVEGEDEEEDLDTPWEIEKRKSYYVIQTLNNRSLIYNVGGKKAIKVVVPEQLDSRDLSYGSSLMKDLGKGRYLYFRQMEKNSIYLFDTQTEKFGHLKIKVDGYIRQVMKNEKNQFLFIVEKEDGTADYMLYEEN